VHSCYVLRVRPTWSSFLSLSILYTHKLTCVSVYIFICVCVIHLYQEKEGIAGSMDKSGITTLVGFSLRENERERERERITKSTLVQVTYYYVLHFTVSFMRWPNEFIRATIGAVVLFFGCAQRTFRRTYKMKNRSIRYIVVTYKRPVYLLYYINSFM